MVDMAMRRAILACLCLSIVVRHAQCGTVLSVLMPGPLSHLFNMKKIAEAVAARGHTVKFLVLDNNAHALQPTDVPVLTYSIPVVKGPFDPAAMKVKGAQNFVQTVADITRVFVSGCDGILSNDTLMAQLKDYNPELLLAETLSPCAQVLASKLDVPFVNFQMYAPIESVQTSAWRGSNRNAFTPNPLAYFPQKDSGIETQHMSFPQRLHNFVAYWKFHAGDYWHVRPIVRSAFRRFGVDPDAPKERRRMVMTMCIADFAIEWLRPLPPSYKLIGAVLPEPAQPLPADLEEFMEGAGDDGVLLVAMGTIATLGKAEQRAMAAAFAKLPVRVLWRLSKSEVPDESAIAELKLGNNTKVATWLPQNDVLGHPRTKAFLSHCGVNGLYEAAYHGVPIIALPFLAEQRENADKAVGRGLALRLNHEDLLTGQFSHTITRVLTERSFKEVAEKLSVKLRARPRTPTQEAADWIEHALATHGEAYLQTPDQDLSLFVRLSLDVWAACLVVIALVILVAAKLARLACAKLDDALIHRVSIANSKGGAASYSSLPHTDGAETVINGAHVQSS
ncbi:UDP-Glycosyltransferase/glycogen phosphorylase [Coccomyxa subellipsoidea C-169]|uniref:Glycosyltransferase n=1 Tax=Coccomyxa subellipsoidea (strain C-169) TaxID=574566 RepID=I0Z2F8_COCSC|nr:UDP-Glycosyltransferase/glycogen phosphorylase [Coccomyxa subellipsoidea C-169]EIE24827.1 UDP-Glycosyltransferase/glycogen phosphorylase [Coccomyxa subellipsoidea C-169]|eukprot:XP_005649371.1 UDP-Glycosyltransferase/glycogen phosphorylase [Coccomyxa subellipsoidea C-169]